MPMATIAAEAGVGVGTMYRHYPTRAELLDDLTRRSFQRMLTHLELAETSAETAAGTFRAFLMAVVADRDQLVLPTTGGPQVLREESRAVQADLHTAIRRVIARGAQDGTILRQLDVWDIAWLGATLAQPGREGDTWDSVCLRLLDTYLAGLGVPCQTDP